MTEKQVFHLLKIRFISGIINFFLFFIFHTFIINIINYIFDYNNILQIFIFLLSFIIYFGLIPKLTNGYTLGGYILGNKIIVINDTKLSIIAYCLRLLFALYSIIKLGAFNFVKVNNLGQLYYDEKFNTTVIDKQTKIDLHNNIKVYEFNMAIEWLKFVVSFVFLGMLLILIYEFL